MNLKLMIPGPERIVFEVLVVTAGVLGAAFLISRFPAIQRFVQSSAVTVKSPTGDILF